MDQVILAIVAAAVAACGVTYYVYAVYLRPYRDCPVCDGTARNRGGIFKKTFNHCKSCGGTGRKIRWLRKRYEMRHPGMKAEWGKRP